jgi:exonuclease VII small subunit
MGKCIPDTERTISGTERILSQMEKGVSETERILSQMEKGISEIEKALSEMERPVSKTERALSQVEKGVSEMEKAVLRNQKRNKCYGLRPNQTGEPEISSPSPPCNGGEGWGEVARTMKDLKPLTLSLSPLGRGEGNNIHHS